jgi:transcriptional regulator with XRE-family HTH domain
MKKISKEGIGARIKALRLQGNLTQADLAEKLTIDRSTLSKIEKGVITPTAQILVDLKNLFVMSIDWLLTGEGIADMWQVDETSNDIKELAMDMAKSEALKHAVIDFYLTYRIKYRKVLNLPSYKVPDKIKKI